MYLYKATLTSPLWLTNVTTVGGKLLDGSLVLDWAFWKERMPAYEAKVQELSAEADAVDRSAGKLGAQ